MIDLLAPQYFQGILGLDLSLKKKSYLRENIVPVFISERTPGENREDLWELLKACDMNYLNRLEWLVRTKTRYSGDEMYVCRPDERRRNGISKSASLGKYKGRARIKIDSMELNEVFSKYELGVINGREAAEKLNISAATFFRRYREYRENIEKVEKCNDILKVK